MLLTVYTRNIKQLGNACKWQKICATGKNDNGIEEVCGSIPPGSTNKIEMLGAFGARKRTAGGHSPAAMPPPGLRR
jgi:hypothetical protein